MYKELPRKALEGMGLNKEEAGRFSRTQLTVEEAGRLHQPAADRIIDKVSTTKDPLVLEVLVDRNSGSIPIMRAATTNPVINLNTLSIIERSATEVSRVLSGEDALEAKMIADTAKLKIGELTKKNATKLERK